MWHNISELDGRLNIYAKNNAFIRSTGYIDIYRIEIDPNKPHIQLKEGLKHRETKQIASLLIRVNRSNEIVVSNDFKKEFHIPSALFFITEETSISYKIICDNCRQDGIIKRIPEMGAIEPKLILDHKTNQVRMAIPIYKWETKQLEDLYGN